MASCRTTIGKLAAAWERKRLPGVIERIDRARYEVLVRNMNIDATLTELFLELRRVAPK